MSESRPPFPPFTRDAASPLAYDKMGLDFQLAERF